MDEKRAATFSPHSTVTKDDRQLYGNSTTSGSAPSQTTAPGIEVQQLLSATDGPWSQNPMEDKEEQYDFVPHFQRVSIGGEHDSGVII